MRYLLFGHDTIECAYYLHAGHSQGIDYARLSVMKEAMRQAKRREVVAVTLGDTEFLLQPYGTNSGYPFVIENRDYSVQFGEYNNPSFFVTFRSEALWQHGAVALHQRFISWADGLGYRPFKPEGLSRVDFSFDYWLPVIDFDEDNFVSLAQKDNQYRKQRRIQTFQFGVDDVLLRVYNKVDEIEEKSAKTWLYDMWGMKEDVWRVEWQTRKALLKRFGIRTFDDLLTGQGDVLRYLVHEHTTLRIKAEDSNRSRWLLHPLWLDLQKQVEGLDYQGVYREIDQVALLNERLMRMAISLYGNLKRIAAVHGVQQGAETVSIWDAMEHFEELIYKVHNPLTWPTDVQKRITSIRLGQW